MLSLWRRRGRQDGVETARGPRSWIVKRLLATWWRFVAGVVLPPIVFRRPVRVHVCFNLRYRLHPEGERMLSEIPYQAERGE
ncbi:hypothetical protein MTP99_004906 [Tenebrio molitor]|nr:hypothetical protein MTP99_004906 [Tenebrio molitor]